MTDPNLHQTFQSALKPLFIHDINDFKPITVNLTVTDRAMLAAYCERTGHSENMAIQTAIACLPSS